MLIFDALLALAIAVVWVKTVRLHKLIAEK